MLMEVVVSWSIRRTFMPGPTLSKIWSILSVHFQNVAVHSNVELAMYAIDSLRQLALKFLEKEELTSFHFQRDFLKPFDHVIGHSKVMLAKVVVERTVISRRGLDMRPHKYTVQVSTCSRRFS